VERVVVEYLARSRFCKEVQIINGLVPGQITRAMDGEDVGSLIVQED
jgi:molybdenum storage protein